MKDKVNRRKVIITAKKTLEYESLGLFCDACSLGLQNKKVLKEDSLLIYIHT